MSWTYLTTVCHFTITSLSLLQLRDFFRSLNANNFADKEKCKLYACLLLFYFICGATTRYDCVTIFQLSSSDCVLC